MKYAVIIPARYRSKRFLGKPLIDLAGKSMIERVWEKCVEAVEQENVFVATDDARIEKHCNCFTDNVVFTSEDCLTGTDRVAEAARLLKLDYAINVQGDEPLVDPADIQKVKNEFEKNDCCVVNAKCPISSESEFRSLTIPKVVTSPSGRLLYISRAPIPGNKSGEFCWGYKQVCIYAYSNKALQKFASAKQKSSLEREEDIEIIRFLEMGFHVQMVDVADGPVAVDTPSDAKKVTKILHARHS